MTSLAVVLVHYRTPELVAPAVAAVLADCDEAGVQAEILLVDNGSDPADLAAWRELPLRRIEAGANLGYAGGVNLGVESSKAPCIVAMNPDVEVLPGCLGALLAELESGADAAGPQFCWDRECRLLLPPTEKRTRRSELLAALGRRLRPLEKAARRRWRQHARRHWLAKRPISSPALSGALLAVRRDAWRRNGPFDAGFRLYFEETDWLLRLERAGGRARFVPAARAVHGYGQSSRREPAAQAWFAEAERRFRSRHYGRRSTWVLEQLARSAAPVGSAAAGSVKPASAPPELPAERLAIDTVDSWVEVAPSPCGFPAAAEHLPRPAAHWSFPASVWERLAPAAIWIRGIDAAGRESPPFAAVRRPAAEEA